MTFATDAPAFDIDLSDAEFEPLPDDGKPTPRRTRRPRSDKGQPRGASVAGSPSRTDKKLADDLLDPWAKIAKGLAFAAPTVAAVMVTRGEKTTSALVSMASPKMKAALGKVSKIGPGTDLAETLLMLVIAAGLDFGRIPPESPIAMFTGVQELLLQTHDVTQVPVDPEVPFAAGPSTQDAQPFPWGQPG